MLRSSIQVVITDGIIFVMGSKRKYQENVKTFNGNGILYFHSAWVKTNTEGKHMLYKINFLVNGISHANLVEASNIELAKSFFIKEHLDGDATRLVEIKENNESYKPGQPCWKVLQLLLQSVCSNSF